MTSTPVEPHLTTSSPSSRQRADAAHPALTGIRPAGTAPLPSERVDSRLRTGAAAARLTGTVVVVGDHPGLRRGVVALIEATGAAVVAVTDLAAAATVIEQWDPDLVVGAGPTRTTALACAFLNRGTDRLTIVLTWAELATDLAVTESSDRVHWLDFNGTIETLTTVIATTRVTA